MAFSKQDFEAFIAELQRNPQLRDRVRDVILADDFLQLPRIVADLGVQVQGLAERMDQLVHRMDVLADRMADLLKVVQLHDGRLGNLEGDLYELNTVPGCRPGLDGGT
jgi:hypothetical protein